jgi:hypothetical protein
MPEIPLLNGSENWVSLKLSLVRPIKPYNHPLQKRKALDQRIRDCLIPLFALTVVRGQSLRH